MGKKVTTVINTVRGREIVIDHSVPREKQKDHSLYQVELLLTRLDEYGEPEKRYGFDARIGRSEITAYMTKDELVAAGAIKVSYPVEPTPTEKDTEQLLIELLRKIGVVPVPEEES